MFGRNLERETGVLMTIVLQSGGENREAISPSRDLPCPVCRSQVVLVYGSGSVHTYNESRLRHTHTQPWVK